MSMIVKLAMKLEAVLGWLQELAIRVTDRGIVTPIQRVTCALTRWRTTAAIRSAVKCNALHISQLESVVLRAFSCLPASLETDSVYMEPEFSGDPGMFLRKVVEGIHAAPNEFGFTNRPWLLLCLAENWTAGCWELYEYLGGQAPKVFFAKPDGSWGVDGYQEWRNGLGPTEFELASDFTLRVRAGFPNQAAVGWDDI